MARIPAVARAALLLATIAPAANAVCTLNLRLQKTPPALVWDVIAGVDSYQVQESFDEFATSRNYSLNINSFPIDHRSSTDVKIDYRVTATVKSNVLTVTPLAEGCSEQLVIGLRGDPQFRALTRKAIIPIAGSTTGAFGAHFKTSLKLLSNAALQRGRIIFHPVGSVAAADDPSMPYDLSAGIGQQIVIDDVVGALGRTGVGSLDIVPDEGASDSVPTVQARSYNDTPGGTFGFTTGAYYPFDFLDAPTLTVIIPSAQFRVNLGIRTLTAVQARALIFGVDGRLREFHDLAWPADFTVLGSVKQVVGVDLKPGEGVELFFAGAGIPFYTVTENMTNDPELMVPGHTHSTDVGSYVE